MPSWRNKPSSKQDYLKRRTFAQGKAEVDAAHVATQRLYCEVLRFWRRCARRGCKRHRRCCGEPTGCLLGGFMFVPQSLRLRARQHVIAGGPRRIAPATHIEWFIRRTDFKSVATWKVG